MFKSILDQDKRQKAGVQRSADNATTQRTMQDLPFSRHKLKQH